MDLTSAATIKELLSKHSARASKGLGQNFLADSNVLKKIIEASDIKSDDFVLEVGPGIGTLTQELAKKAGHVLAIEKDETMVEILKETLKDFKNVEVVNDDILKSEISKQTPKSYKVIANIPYYLTSPLIRKLLEDKNPSQEIVLMIQKEVAQRICSAPPKMSLLAVSVQFYAKAKTVFNVSKNCFWPAPKIDSAIIRITPFAEKQNNTESFFKIVKAGFSQPRKQLAGNLSKSLEISKEKAEEWLLKNKIQPNQRAETLSIEDWKALTNSFE